MGSKRNGDTGTLASSSEEDEGGQKKAIRKSGRKRSAPAQTFRIHSSDFLTSSNRNERKNNTAAIALDVNKSEGEIRDILITELPQLRDESFEFFTKDKAGKWYFCPCSLKCEAKDHSPAEWNGRNIPRAAKSNRAVYISIKSTTLGGTESFSIPQTSETRVQDNLPTNPMSSDSRTRSVEQYSSNPLNANEVRVVFNDVTVSKEHQSVRSCPDLSLSGLRHQENTSGLPLSVQHGNSLNQRLTQLTLLPQEKNVPETGYERVKDGDREGEEVEGEKERKENDGGDEEIKKDMGTTLEETRLFSGPQISVKRVQSDLPANLKSSDPQFRLVGQSLRGGEFLPNLALKSNPLNEKEVRVVVNDVVSKEHQSVSCPDLSLSGSRHRENTSWPPPSAKQRSDINQWPTQSTLLPQEESVPETRNERVKDGDRVEEEVEGEKEQKENDEGDEQMQRDMWMNGIPSTGENILPERQIESGYETFFSESSTLLRPVDATNSVEDEEFQPFFVSDSQLMDTNFNGTLRPSTPTQLSLEIQHGQTVYLIVF